MKRLNKILALVLALTMMFGVLSVCASAVDTVNAGYQIAFKDADKNAISSAKAGEVVDVYVSIKTNSYSPLFAFLAFYDSTALTHTRYNVTEVKSIKPINASELLGRFANTSSVKDPSQDLIDHEDDEIGSGPESILDWGAAEPSTTPHTDDMYPSSFTDAQKAQFKGVNFGYLAPTSKTVLGVHTNNEFEEMVRIRFIANKDVTLNSDIFYFLDDITSTYIAVDPDDEPFSNLQTSKAVKVSDLKVEYATAGGNEGGDDTGDTPTVTAPVSSKEVQVKWKDKANKEIYIGFCGEYTGTVTTTKDPVTGKDIVNEIYEIGFIMSTSDESLATHSVVPAETLYDFGSGTYKFRAVTSSTTDSTLPLYGKAYIQLTKDSEKLLANDKIETTVAAEYEEATKMPGFNA